MSYRCPTALVVSNAKLEGYQLLFRGGNGGAVATVEKRENAFVPVLVWELEPDDELALDRYEGYPSFYRKVMVKINFDGKWHKVMAYIMNDGHPFGMPSQYYYNTILQGYKSAGLDVNILNKAVKISAEKE
jgi:hypothetical protein